MKGIDQIKVLSVRQPWAWLIVSGYKDIENRTWSTNHRGKVLIHASKGFDHNSLPWIWNNQPTRVYLDVIDHFDIVTYCHSYRTVCRDQSQFGGIVGAVDITNITNDSSSRWAQPDCRHWKLENPIAFQQMIPCKGKLQLWNAPEELHQTISKEIEKYTISGSTK